MYIYLITAAVPDLESRFSAQQSSTQSSQMRDLRRLATTTQYHMHAVMSRCSTYSRQSRECALPLKCLQHESHKLTSLWLSSPRQSPGCRLFSARPLSQAKTGSHNLPRSQHPALDNQLLTPHHPDSSQP